MYGGPGRKGSRAVAEVAGQGPDQWAAQTGFTVLVAKVLTPSDANSGRIILPRTMVEANLNFIMGYRCPPPPSFPPLSSLPEGKRPCPPAVEGGGGCAPRTRAPALSCMSRGCSSCSIAR